jgi:hypothetical protein
MSEWNRKFGFTMIHGDFHGQNMLQRGDSADTIAFLDWQVGGGARVLHSVFLRNQNEQELCLEMYE